MGVGWWEGWIDRIVVIHDYIICAAGEASKMKAYATHERDCQATAQY